MKGLYLGHLISVRIMQQQESKRQRYQRFQLHKMLLVPLICFRSNLTSRWAISSDLGSDLVMVENRGRGCPGRLHSSWRFLDGDLGSFVEDKSLRVLCPSAPCGSSPCGHGAKCDQDQELCTCEEGSTGDPHTRCYPKISKNSF